MITLEVQVVAGQEGSETVLPDDALSMADCTADPEQFEALMVAVFGWPVIPIQEQLEACIPSNRNARRRISGFDGFISFFLVLLGSSFFGHKNRLSVLGRAQAMIVVRALNIETVAS